MADEDSKENDPSSSNQQEEDHGRTEHAEGNPEDVDKVIYFNPNTHRCNVFSPSPSSIPNIQRAMSLLFQTKLCNSEKNITQVDSVGPAYYIIDKAIFMK